MLQSPGTPRRPQTATERLASVRSNLNTLKENVHASESYSLSHLAASSSPRSQRPVHSAPTQRSKAPTPPPAGQSTEAWAERCSSSGRSDADRDVRPTNYAAGLLDANNARRGPPQSIGASRIGTPRAKQEVESQYADGTLSTNVAIPTATSAAVAHYSAQLPTAATIQSVEDALLVMRQHATKIEEHLGVEATARLDGDRKLKAIIEHRVREAMSNIEKKAAERITEVHMQLDQLTKKLEKVQNELALEREKNVRLTQELKYQATQGLADVRDQVGQVRGFCQSSQGALTKKMDDDLFRLQERLDVERHARENIVRNIREEIAVAAKQREKQDDRILQKLKDDITSVEVLLKRESEIREKGEEQLAATMEEVVAQIQLGLRNISK